MSKKRELIVLILCMLSELGMCAQILKPNWCTGTSFIMFLVGGNQLSVNVDAYHVSHIITAVIVAIAMLGMILFAVSVARGNAKGRLELSYFIILIHHIILLVSAVAIQKVWVFSNKSDTKLNVTIFFVSELFMVVMMAMYVLREHGRIRLIPNISAVLLMVTFGQFIANGMLVDALSTKRAIIYGIIAALPTFTIFVFEKFILEPTMRRY